MLTYETYGIDVFGDPRTEPYYDGTGRGYLREPCKYIRFPSHLVQQKVSLLCEYIRTKGVDGLEEYEREVTLDLAETLKKPVRDTSHVLTPRPTCSANSCTPQNGLDRPSSSLSSVDFEGANWKSKDTPLLYLASRWILATDYELQWVLYHRRGLQWKARAFPTTRETLLRYLREDGIEAPPPTIQLIQSWPPTFRGWLQQQEKRYL